MRIVVVSAWATRYGVSEMVGQPAIVQADGVYTLGGIKLAGAFLADALLQAGMSFDLAAAMLGRPERSTDPHGSDRP